MVEGQLLVVTGELDRAGLLMRRADEIFEQQMDAFGSVDNLLGRARLLKARRRPDEGRRLIEEAVRRLGPEASRNRQLAHALRFGAAVLGLMSGTHADIR